MSIADLARFGGALADAAAAETLHRWRAGCAAEDKNAGGAFDPVTAADREAERAMAALIETEYPGHGIDGEEYGSRGGAGPYRWSLDPVDGTRAFICGVPTWVTLIALLEDGQPILGIIDAPATGERFTGHGDTATLRCGGGGDIRLSTSACSRLEEARLTTTDPGLFAAGAEDEAYRRVADRTRLRRYGLDGYGYAKLAAGSIDIVVESGLKPHDYNALIPLVRAAGGSIGDWRGGTDFEGGRVVAAATPALFDQALELLSAA